MMVGTGCQPSSNATGDDFMKGLFVTDGKLDERAWSGTSMCLYRELGRHFDLAAVEQVVPSWYDLCNEVVNHLPGRKRLAPDRTLPWRRRCAAEVAAACERERPDFVFAPGSLSLAFVDAGVPLFCYIDGTVRAISQSYGGWERSDIEKADALERDALIRTAFVFCASDWVARSVVGDYSVDPSRIGVVGIGANNEIPVGDFGRVADARLKSLGGGGTHSLRRRGLEAQGRRGRTRDAASAFGGGCPGDARHCRVRARDPGRP
jgi:hypothetical protein